MYRTPDYSPWGEVQSSEFLAPGIFMVSTPSHGGIMVLREATQTLSAAARECGFWDGSYLCYEEDCQACVVLRELLDRDRHNVPHWIKDTAAYERELNDSLQRFNPAYWEARRDSRPSQRRPGRRRTHSAPVR